MCIRDRAISPFTAALISPKLYILSCLIMIGEWWTLLNAGEQTKSEQKLLQNNQYRHLLDIHELLRGT